MLEEVSLFRNRRDFFHFLLLAFTFFSLSISLEFYNYKELTKFDSQLVHATVLKQYEKTKLTKTGKTKTYQVLKLKSKKGSLFYTTASKNLRDIKYKEVQLEVWAGKISFYEYMSSFYGFSKILQIHEDKSYKTQLNSYIDSQHQNKDISLLYQALFSAKQLPYELQVLFSNLGVSHLIAISGFHLGVLSAILFFLIKYPYKLLQNRYFPYRSYKIDSFIIISTVLLGYLLFLDSPPSLLRAFVMLVVGFMLYDRGIQIISMQTLLLSVILIVSLFPRLFLSIGLWLSVGGVYYIFLFLIYFKEKSKTWQFFILPFWVYLLMLPFSLVIFGNFSIYHPLSIIMTSLFTLFYPVAMLFHFLNYGNLMDGFLRILLEFDTNAVTLSIENYYLYIYIGVSLLVLYKKSFLLALLLSSLVFFIYAVYNVT
ncbi:MAG: ComEC/Rec2 family competence protein [Campylobacterota bacterium]|nr:ComEC/Rec2 family competence protein [Campylobacterota bacterium]